MTKYKKIIETTTNNRIYKNLQKIRDKDVICWICFKRSNHGDIYAGCGCLFEPKREIKNWKYYRKNQYRINNIA